MKVFVCTVIFSMLFVSETCFGFFVLVVNVKSPGACYRRVLAGKRIARRFVRRSLFCERIEDCQLECAEERRFTCEGFNYRLDPTGRGKGECELLDVPLQRLDIGRDVYPDRDYDYYEKDRNAAATNCRYDPPHPDHGISRPPGHRPPYDGYPPYDRRPSYDVRPPPDYHRRPSEYVGRPIYDGRPSVYDRDRRPVSEYDRRRPPVYDRRPPPNYGPEYDRRGGKDPHGKEIPDVLCVHLNRK